MAIIAKPENTPGNPNSLASEAEATPGNPNSLTPEAEANPGNPNSLTAEAEVSPGNPNSLTAESEAAPGNPNSLTAETEATPGNPSTLIAETEATPGNPNSLTPESEATPGNPNTLTAKAVAGFPRALTPLVDMHFDSQDYSQNGNPVLFDDLFTYARSSNATFINRRIVNNKAEFFLDTDFVGTVTNLLTFSEQFDNAAWTKVRVSVLANSTKSPDGSMTADRLIEDSTVSDTHLIRMESISFTSGNPYTFSASIKKNGRSEVFMELQTAGFPSLSSAIFNLNAGTVTANIGLDGAIITPEGNDWFRCSITSTADATTGIGIVDINLLLNGAESYSGDGVSGVFLARAQLTQSAKVQPYVKTISSSDSDTFTESLRIEYDPATGENLGALIEGDSTNLALRSEEFDSSPTWTLSTAAISENSFEAPDGTISADELDLSASGFMIQTLSSFSTSIGEMVSFSMFVKSSSQVISYGGATVAGTDVYSFKDVGNGYFRQIIVRTFSVATSGSIQLAISDAVAGVGKHVLWGSQFERSAFATSYIRTEGSTVTRAADALGLPVAGNAADFNAPYSIHAKFDFINSNDGSIARSVFHLKSPLSSSIAAGTSIFLGSPDVLNARSSSDSFSTLTVSADTEITSTVTKNANAIFYIDSAEINNITSSPELGTPDSFTIGNTAGMTNPMFGHIKELSSYEEALTAQEVALL